jgi:hypothetical protein
MPGPWSFYILEPGDHARGVSFSLRSGVSFSLRY